MTSGEMKTALLKKRSFIVSEIEDIIKTSVYYRNHSDNFDDESKIVVAKFDDTDSKKKIL
jgi:hypothetical protein